MKYVLTLTLSVFILSAQGQIPKRANVIEVSGVTFKQVATGLLDLGYTFEKIDSNYQTVRTEFKDIKGYAPTVQLDIRVKDSIAIIKGSWMSGGYMFTIENIKAAAYKFTFGEMNTFALSFKKPVSYFVK